ncbi:MAG: MFS transporter [Actinomycetales bacterium]|nr:MFS transporter [Actinomycetales bacterium]
MVTPRTASQSSQSGSVPAPGGGSDRQRWIALVGIALGVALVIMDATIANVALPVVIRDLGLTATETQWMNAIYSLVFAALILLAGRLSDIHGRRLMLLAGLTLFMLASLAVGSAPTPAFLIGARLVQGIGAAFVMPSTLSTINALFHGRERAIAFAVYGSMIGGMAAVGPLLGGWLATDFSWRWAFWINIPFSLAAIVVAVRYVPETRDPNVRHGIDVPGTLLASIGMTAIVYGLIESSQYGWLAGPSGEFSPVPWAIGGGLALMAAFVAVERRRERADLPVLAHLGMFAVPTFRYGLIAALIVSLGEFGMLFVLPLLLQGAMGYDAIHTGWIMMALAGGTFLSSGMVPRATRRLGQRAVVRLGLALEAVAIAGLALALPTGHWQVAGILAVYGVGVGLATAQLTNTILEDVPVAQSGEASGMTTTVRQIGTSLGIALLGGLLISGLTSGTRDGLEAAGAPPAVVDSLVEVVRESVGAAIPGLAADPATAQAADIAADALIDAAKLTTGIAAGVLGIGVLATIALPRREEDDDAAAPAPSSPAAAG